MHSKIFFWIVLLLMTCSGFAGDDILGSLLKARYAMMTRNYEHAIRLAEEARVAAPFDADAVYLEIEVMLAWIKSKGAPKSDDIEAVLKRLSYGLKYFPKDYRFYMTLGKSLSMSQRWTRYADFKTPDVYLEQALALMAHEKDADADRIETQYQLGLWYFSREESFKAAEHLQKVCDADATMPWAFYYAGQASENSGQFLTAKHLLEKYQTLGMRDLGASKRPLGLGLTTLETILNPNRANVRKLLKTLESEGGSAYLYYDSALRFYRLGMLDISRKLLKTYEQKEALDGQSLNLFLRILMEQHKYEEVVSASKQALKGDMNPRSQRIWIDYAVEAALLAQKPTYIRDLQRVYGQREDVADRLNLLKAFSDGIFENEPQGIENYLTSGENRGFADFLKQEIDQKGMNVTLIENMTQFYQARMDWQGGVAFLIKFTNKKNPNPFLWDELADSYALAKDWDRAFGWYEKILQKSPNRPDILNNYGYFLAQNNRELDKAFNLIARAVELAPNTPAYLDSMGWVSFKKGDLPSAEHFLLKALSQEPDSPEKLDHLGDILMALGNTLGARASWSKAMQLIQKDASFLGHEKILEIIKKLDSGISLTNQDIVQ